MFRRLFPFFLVAIWCSAQQLHVSTDRLRASVKYLASDELEGRGVGTNGEKLATNYIATQLQAENLKPAGDQGTYFQAVPLVGVTTRPQANLKVSPAKGSPFTLNFVTDFIGAPGSQKAVNQFDADAIFVGHGITAPEYGWDDYKDVDVKGKIVVLFTNEPPSGDLKFFNGPALTYYGRWIYKFEEATRHGAAAALIIHTTATAGYGFGVIKGSATQERPQLRLKEGGYGLKLAAWLTEDAGAKLTAATGKSLDQLLAQANQKGFRPFPLGVKIRGDVPVKLRNFESRNVIGRVDGSDAAARSQAVLYSAHWDHLGRGVPVKGDAIYNGAVDNATGCAEVLELARIWAALPQKPKRSALFLFVTAEESGLLGSQYFGEHPVMPAGQIAANINYDALPPFGRVRDVELTGAERTTLWPLVQRDATRAGLVIKPDAQPGQGHYYRSDHFSLARVGVPAFSISPGIDYVGKPDGFGAKVFEDYNSYRYHQPSDEYNDNWDMSGMEQMADLGLILGMDFANTPQLPTWNPGDEFLKARQPN